MEDKGTNLLETQGEKLLLDFTTLMEKMNVPSDYIELLNVLTGSVIIIILVWLSDFITKKILLRSLTSITKKTKSDWDDILLEKKVFNRLAHLHYIAVCHSGNTQPQSRFPIVSHQPPRRICISFSYP